MANIINFVDVDKWNEAAKFKPDGKAFAASAQPEFGTYLTLPHGNQYPQSRQYIDRAMGRVESMTSAEIRAMIDYNINANASINQLLARKFPDGVQVWAAGGYVNSIVDPVRPPAPDEFGVTYNKPKDIDLFIVGNVHCAAKVKASREIMKYLMSYHMVSYYTRNQYAMTAVLNSDGKEALGVSLVQIVTTNASSIAEILKWFDVDCCAVALRMGMAVGSTWHHPELVAESRAIYAIYNRVNFHRPGLITPSYGTRLNKYMTRGYDYVVPSSFQVSKPAEGGMWEVVRYGAQTRAASGDESVYSGREEAFICTADYRKAQRVYIESRDLAKAPAVLSLDFDDAISGFSGKYAMATLEELIHAIQSNPSVRKQVIDAVGETILEEWIRVSKKGGPHILARYFISPFPTLPMSTLPPLDFSLTPEAMKNQSAKGMDMSGWPAAITK